MTLAFAPIESEVQQRLVPHESMEWGSNSIQLGTCRRSSDVCAQWRNHFSQIASCQNAEFDTVFAAAISDQFRAFCADQATGEFDVPFTDSEFVWALGQCSDSATGGDGLPYSVWIGGGAFCWISSTSCSHGMPFLQHGSPARFFQSSNTEIAQILTITDRYLWPLVLSRCLNTSFMDALRLISFVLTRPKVVSDGVPMRLCTVWF